MTLVHPLVVKVKEPIIWWWHICIVMLYIVYAKLSLSVHWMSFSPHKKQNGYQCIITLSKWCTKNGDFFSHLHTPVTVARSWVNLCKVSWTNRWDLGNQHTHFKLVKAPLVVDTYIWFSCIPGSSKYVKYLPFGKFFGWISAQILHTWKIQVWTTWCRTTHQISDEHTQNTYSLAVKSASRLYNTTSILWLFVAIPNAPCMIYLPTFTINWSQIYKVNIPFVPWSIWYHHVIFRNFKSLSQWTLKYSRLNGFFSLLNMQSQKV